MSRAFGTPPLIVANAGVGRLLVANASGVMTLAAIGENDILQPGVVGATGGPITGAIGATTRIVTLTNLPTDILWFTDPTSGAKVRAVFGTLGTQTATALTTGQFAALAIDAVLPTTYGGTCTFELKQGTAQTTAALAATNLAAQTTGRVRIWDGIMSFVTPNYTLVTGGSGSTLIPATGRDRRPFARGFKSAGQITSGSYTTASTTNVAIDTARLQFRVECTGNSFEFKLTALVNNSVSASGMNLSLFRDGANIDLIYSDTMLAASAFKAASAVVVDTPAAGSHLYTWMWSTVAGTAGLLAATGPPVTPACWSIAEDLRPNSNNGTA